ncbi:TIGR03667 family PPOX class F420-dependent oxidoreductase [Nocardia niigatensis]|uniref:TIGR03667 family PPOX class F420-dependent oxidoreductase n=1 Tax=Nocardia niigatensis TaxID=209249 RepID=UPI0002FDABBE|nr:TIGR03667 family PPOX class F420-dependent oxidoreductase [Nocardia niigatensis]
MSSSSSLIDSNTDFGVKVSKHLVQDTIIWLTTVSPSGTPQPNPVWFQWDDGAFLVFTQPDTPKLRNIAANSRVSLNLNSTATGGDVIVFTGTARVDADGASAAELDAFVEKYTEGLVDIGMTREQFFADYSIPVRIVPDRLRGF